MRLADRTEQLEDKKGEKIQPVPCFTLKAGDFCNKTRPDPIRLALVYCKL